MTFAAHKATATSTRLARLAVAEVPSGSTVTVTCKGKGCPKRFVKRNVSGTVSLAAYIRKSFRAGTVHHGQGRPSRARIRVAATITIRKGKAPRLSLKDASY